MRAYQYTNIARYNLRKLFHLIMSSVMLLDCFTIPCVMILSRLILKTKYHLKQFLGVALCVIGLVILILSDYFYNPKEAGNE